MDSEQENKIAEFCSITGADVERAEFFLQATGWDTSAAVSTFFENDHEEEDQLEPQRVQRPSEQPEVPAAASTSSGAAARKTNPSKIHTFSSFANQQSKSDDEEEGQAYYAGGSKESGQQILGPPKSKKKGDHVAEELFRAAKEHGAEVVSESDNSASRRQPNRFVGTGYRLGESVSEAAQPVMGATQKKPPVSVVLKLWKTGFTINDEPLRTFDDPKNKQFLQSIQKGEIPQELVAQAAGGKVELDMEDHREEDYVPPKQPKIRAFTGAGQTLGGEASTQASTSASVESGSARAVIVDTSAPVTNLQIRLADGTRLVSKFNHTHTVGDVRSHIVASRPQYAGVAFSLLTTLPSRTLSDANVTLKDADLLNAAVMQKLS